MPPGFDTMLPAPTTVTVSVLRIVNVAVAALPAAPMTVHGSVPVDPPPLHPGKSDSAFAAAVSVTEVPSASASLQSAPQSMPAGDDVTVPPPLPSSATDKPAVATASG